MVTGDIALAAGADPAVWGPLQDVLVQPLAEINRQQLACHSFVTTLKFDNRDVKQVHSCLHGLLHGNQVSTALAGKPIIMETECASKYKRGHIFALLFTQLACA